MVDEVREFLKMYNADDDHTESSEIDKIIEADCNDLYDRVKADCENIYKQTEKRLDDLFSKYRRDMYPLPQIIDLTNKKAFIVLGIFENDSVPHDMRLLIFAENEEKARELIDERYSTDTSFFMVKNIKEA